MLSHIGLWIGEDDYDTTKVCGKVHAQQKSLRPVTGQKLTVFRRTTADDKAMRNSNGSFTTCSAYDIPYQRYQAHIDQLGVMKILLVKPTGSLLKGTEKTSKNVILFKT